MPSRWWTSCRTLCPWKLLPRPSRRATMMFSELTSTESQFMLKRSLTVWPPGVLRLQKHNVTSQWKCLSNQNFSQFSFWGIFQRSKSTNYIWMSIFTPYRIMRSGCSYVSSKSLGTVNSTWRAAKKRKQQSHIILLSGCVVCPQILLNFGAIACISILFIASAVKTARG